MPASVKKKNFSMIGISKRKLFFFLVIFAVCIFGIRAYSINKFSADSLPGVEDEYSSSLSVKVEIEKDGKIAINDQPTTQKIDFANNEVRIKILDNPGRAYSKVSITLISPVENSSKFEPDLIVQHGVEEKKIIVKDSRTIEYTATTVSPYATITVVSKIPPGTVNPGFWDIFKGKQNLNFFWLLAAIILPIITVITMLFFLFYQHKRQKVDMPDQETTQPPMAIPPAIVGALFSQKVGPREIAATIIDLAQRGDIVIIDQERGFSFGKGRFDTRLLGYEKILLSKIFEENTISASQQEIEKRINRHLYSKKMSAVTLGIFALATRLGYFKVNPRVSLIKYHLVAITYFVIALGGFILSLFKFTNPPYVIFFWVGMMLSSLIISFAVKKLPIRTIIGQEVLSNWLAFRKYLSNPEQFPYSSNNQEIFQKYLPYAVVMGCEAAWAKRFENHNFVMPEWFFSYRTGLGLEDFCLSLFPIISYVGQSLATAREPGYR